MTLPLAFIDTVGVWHLTAFVLTLTGVAQPLPSLNREAKSSKFEPASGTCTQTATARVPPSLANTSMLLRSKPPVPAVSELSTFPQLPSRTENEDVNGRSMGVLPASVTAVLTLTVYLPSSFRRPAGLIVTTASA